MLNYIIFLEHWEGEEEQIFSQGGKQHYCLFFFFKVTSLFSSTNLSFYFALNPDFIDTHPC